ncbi:MAG: hypothetical protein KDC05_16765, partial [Bacteroidales bacterium]|nr:hypothetical protein [Bacteroidales bacterium]
MITDLRFFKGIIVLTIFLSTTQLNRAAIYESTPAGGYWSQPATWVGGIVPLSTTDTVYINSNVLLDMNVQIKDIIIDTNVTFQNATFTNYTLGIDGDLINYGTIQNNYYFLYINLWGGLYQHGVLSNYQLKLYNTQHDIDASQPLTVQYFNLANGAKDINVVSDTLHFIGTQVSVLGADFYFNDGLLTLDGGYMINGDIIANNLDINLVNGAYIGGTNITADYVGLYGTFNTLTNNFYGNSSDVVVEVVGILQNNSSANYVMTINGDLINNGTIQNNYYVLTLNITGDITNNGTWTNQTTNLSGAENQTIAFTQPFYGTYLNNANINGYFIASTDLEFVGTSVDLNGDTLYFSNSPASLTLSGGYLREYNIIGPGSPNEITIDLSSNAYLHDGTFTHDGIFLVNTFQFSGSLTCNGNLTVQGSMQNTSSSNYTATINGDVTNNGSISNNFYILTLNITGDIVNNGTWENQYTNLSGAEDQSMWLNNPYSGPFLTNTNGAGKILAQTNLIFNNTLFDMNLDTLVFMGASDSLVINGNNLREARIIREASKATGTLKVNLTNSAWTQDVRFFADQVDLFGVYQFSGDMKFYANMVVNHGLLRNYASSNYTAEVFGNLVNNGTIANNSYNLYVNVTGDITQNGSWTN